MAVVAPGDIGNARAGGEGAEVLAGGGNNQDASRPSGKEVAALVEFEAIATAARSSGAQSGGIKKYPTISHGAIALNIEGVDAGLRAAFSDVQNGFIGGEGDAIGGI